MLSCQECVPRFAFQRGDASVAPLLENHVGGYVVPHQLDLCKNQIIHRWEISATMTGHSCCVRWQPQTWELSLQGTLWYLYLHCFCLAPRTFFCLGPHDLSISAIRMTWLKALTVWRRPPHSSFPACCKWQVLTHSLINMNVYLFPTRTGKGLNPLDSPLNGHVHCCNVYICIWSFSVLKACLGV